MKPAWYLFNEGCVPYIDRDGSVMLNSVAKIRCYVFVVEDESWHYRSGSFSWSQIKEEGVPDEIRMKLLLVME